MNIRKMEKSDIPACAEILCSVYNNELWMCRWSKETAEEYLTDFFKMEKFVGYVLEDNSKICGGIFAHEKVWWNNSEVFVEEMFIRPELQRKGYGTALLNRVEEYVKEKRLAGYTPVHKQIRARARILPQKRLRRLRARYLYGKGSLKRLDKARRKSFGLFPLHGKPPLTKGRFGDIIKKLGESCRFGRIEKAPPDPLNLLVDTIVGKQTYRMLPYSFAGRIFLFWR